MRAQDRSEQRESARPARRADTERAAGPENLPAATLLELQRTWGNDLVTGMLAAGGHPAAAGRVVQLMPNEDAKSGGEHEREWQGPLAETVKKHQDQIAALVKACTCTPATNQEGRMTGELVVRGPRDREGDRPQQTLQHIAIRLLRSIRYLEDAEREKWAGKQKAGGQSSGDAHTEGAHTKSETEVQVMLVRERLVIATNRNPSITLLEKSLPEQISARQTADAMDVDDGEPALHGGHWLQDVLLEEGRRPAQNKVTAGGDEAMGRGRRARGKLNQVYQGTRKNDVGDALRGVRAVVSANITDPSERLAELLTSDEYKNTVILLRGKLSLGGDGSATMHAEQKHLSVLAAAADVVGAASVGPAVIRGQRRPCSSCWALFHLFSGALDVEVDFSDRPGLYFHEGTTGASADERLSGLVTAQDIEGRYSFAELVKGIERMNVSAKSTVVPEDLAGERGVARPKQVATDQSTGEALYTLDDERLDPGYATASESEVEDTMSDYEPNIGVLPEIRENVTKGQAAKLARGESADPAPRVSPMAGKSLTELTPEQKAELDAAKAAGANNRRHPRSRGGHAPKISTAEWIVIDRLITEANESGQKGMNSAIGRYFKERDGHEISQPAISKGLKTHRAREKAQAHQESQ